MDLGPIPVAPTPETPGSVGAKTAHIARKAGVVSADEQEGKEMRLRRSAGADLKGREDQKEESGF